jgi:hypothetical protein
MPVLGVRAPGLILALVCGLLLAGCGGDSAPVSAKDRYERQFAKTIEAWEERAEREAPDVPDDAPLSEHAEEAAVAVEMMRGMGAPSVASVRPPTSAASTRTTSARSAASPTT